MPYPFTSAYNASKAALAQWSETLRIELEPLNIKVVTVVTGQVATNLPQLPVLSENSIYKPLQTQLEARAKTHIGMLPFSQFPIDVAIPSYTLELPSLIRSQPTDKGTKPEDFATALLKAVSTPSPKPWVWQGTNSRITWLVSTFAWKTAFVSRSGHSI